MSLETLGKDNAAELELEKDKYIVLKRKLYELDEKVRVGNNAYPLFSLMFRSRVPSSLGGKCKIKNVIYTKIGDFRENEGKKCRHRNGSGKP